MEPRMKTLRAVIGAALLQLAIATQTTVTASPRWAEVIGTQTNDSALSIQQTVDSGFVLAGYSGQGGSTGADDNAFMAKTNAKGTLKWQKVYWQGETFSWYAEQATSIQQTSDGGYAVVGFVENGRHYYGQAFFMKLDASGSMQWQEFFGGRLSVPRCVRPTSDGGFIVVADLGFINVEQIDTWLLKLNSTGTLVFQKKLGKTTLNEYPAAVEQTPDGGYVVAGRIEAARDSKKSDAMLLRTDANGSLIWWVRFGGPGADNARSLQLTSDDGIIVAGQTMSYGAGREDAWVVKFDSAGRILWQKAYGGKELDGARSIRPSKDGGWFVGGQTKLAGSYSYAWLFKLDASGGILWQKGFGANAAPQAANAVWEMKDGGCVVAGYSQAFGDGDPDILLVRVDKTGAVGTGCTVAIDTSCKSTTTSTSALAYKGDVADTYTTPITGMLESVQGYAAASVICSGSAEYRGDGP